MSARAIGEIVPIATIVAIASKSWRIVFSTPSENSPFVRME
jgi:hypothetical protein